MQDFNYIEQAQLTMSTNYHEGVPATLIGTGLNVISKEIDRLDQIKKFMFYGRQSEGLNQAIEFGKVMFPNETAGVNFEALLPGRSREDAINLFHGIIGAITEAGELARALSEAITNGTPLNLSNVAEEIGDGQWYNAAILKVLGLSFDQIQRANIAKLRNRFPNKFNEYDANNRDTAREMKPIDELFLEREREIVGASKPQAIMNNWFLMGTSLFGDCPNHPKLGDITDARTSRCILTKDAKDYKQGDTIETKNTIYLLGTPAK